MSKEEKKEEIKEEIKSKAINTKKWLYSFIVPRTSIKIIKEEKVNDEGQKVTTEKEEKFKEEVEVFLKRPTRKIYDECNLFYSVKVSEGIKKGLMTRAMLSKRYRDDKGALSDEEKDQVNAKYQVLLTKEKEYQMIQLNLLDEEIDIGERQERLDGLITEIEILKNDLESFEFAAESLYEHTAEARAGRLSNMWWLLNLTYVKHEDENKVIHYTPFFSGKNFDEKSQAYSIIEEKIHALETKQVLFETGVIEISTYLLSAWNGGNVKTYDDFEKVHTSLDQIKEEVKDDEALQVIYEQRVRQLAGIDIEFDEEEEEEEEPKKEPKEEPEEEPKEEPKPEEEPKEEPKKDQPVSEQE
ncbi:MAG TPA: hypothetical protein EYG21_00890 [Nitrospinaceae bacterium]|nr:hypothetical protein [Nitrospinaceae bacterium]